MFLRYALAVALFLRSFAHAVPATLPRAASDGARLTVYWGAEDDSTTLADVCADSSYDIVNLAFLSYFFAGGGYPELSLSTLDGPSKAQSAAGATDLQDGSSLVSAIEACQSAGKLVILSLGGAVGFADVTLDSDDQAQQIAETLWNLFLGGTADSTLRPFGSLKLDGLDIDNESGDPTGYTAFVTAMRSYYASDTSKTYYLTAAPQCPYPDASVPLDVCTQLDYVWVQFYNNDDCNIAQSDFTHAVQQWSAGIGDAQLFIGALASGADGDQGYVSSSTLLSSIKSVENMDLPNFGGAMLWEAQLAVKNGNYQKAIAAGL